MKRNARLMLMGLLLTAVAGCATMAGGIICWGFGSRSGDTAAGASIGAGVGMIIDIAN